MIVLDTHAWLWLHDSPEKLSQRARGAVDASNELLVSTISAWELAMLVQRRRIRPDRPVDEWIDRAVTASRTRLVDVDLEIALEGATLMTTSLDPADAIVAATALAFHAPVVTRDRRLAGVPDLRTIW